MKIRVTNLPPEGLPVSGAISLEAINARLQEGRPIDITFTEAPMASLHVSATAEGGAEIQGTVVSTVQQSCGRCNEPQTHSVSSKIHTVTRPAATREGAEPNDDPDLIYLEGDTVDIEERLQEALILKLSPYWSPECSDDGRCIGCDRSCDDSEAYRDEQDKPTTLGDLFKKAKIV
jgi:uncharacterized metal-binding protein YceD (DUF177 family)